MRFTADPVDGQKLTIDFTDFNEYTTLITSKLAYGSYVHTLYQACVGRTMPVHITVNIPMPPDHSNLSARSDELVTALLNHPAVHSDSVKATLTIWGEISHQELDGFPLAAEHLPMIAGQQFKPVARRVNAEQNKT